MSQSVLDKLTARFTDESHAYRGDETFVVADKGHLTDVVRFLRNEADLAFDQPTDMTVVDPIGHEPRFEVVYQLRSTKHKHRVRVKALVSEEQPTIASATPLYRGWNWFEREAFDMYGIRFTGHPDLRRILMPEVFPDFPLRKEYPVQGKGAFAAPRRAIGGNVDGTAYSACAPAISGGGFEGGDVSGADFSMDDFGGGFGGGDFGGGDMRDCLAGLDHLIAEGLVDARSHEGIGGEACSERPGPLLLGVGNRHHTAALRQRRKALASDRAAADHAGAECLHECHRFFDRVSAANDVVDDNARIHLALVDVLAKHAFTFFLFSPVDLFRVKCVAHTEGDGNSSRTRTDNRNFRKLARNVFFKSKLSTQCYCEYAGRVVVTKSQWHLKIVLRVFAVWINEVALAKRAGALQNLHDGILRRNQLNHAVLLRCLFQDLLDFRARAYISRRTFD